MSGYSNPPKPVKGGFVLVDPVSGAILRSPYREVADPHSHFTEEF